MFTSSTNFSRTVELNLWTVNSRPCVLVWLSLCSVAFVSRTDSYPEACRNTRCSHSLSGTKQDHTEHSSSKSTNNTFCQSCRKQSTEWDLLSQTASHKQKNTHTSLAIILPASMCSSIPSGSFHDPKVGDELFCVFDSSGMLRYDLMVETKLLLGYLNDKMKRADR